MGVEEAPYFMFGRKKGGSETKANIYELLESNYHTIVKKWIDKVYDSYPEDGAKFLRNKKDPFANPVGFRITRGIEGLVKELITEEPSEGVEEFLDSILRVRAVQDFVPGDAVAFIFELKKVIREVLAKQLRDNIRLMEELLDVETKIDRLALLAFDIYMGCREKLFQLKVEEIKKRPFLQLEGVSCPSAALSLRQMKTLREQLNLVGSRRDSEQQGH